VREIAMQLASGSISDDEFQRALAPEINSLKQSERENAYWLDVINNCQERPECLQWARGRIADNESITKNEVQALAQAYLPADKAIVIDMTPDRTDRAHPIVALE
ncbi:MAG TPA: hypothetical protein VIY86_11275, partial [Pirellulaceae bacterium]